jgi:hypothetical protein
VTAARPAERVPIVPGPLSVNPSMTITALSEQVAQWMIHGQEVGARRPIRRSSPAIDAQLAIVSSES